MWLVLPWVAVGFVLALAGGALVAGGAPELLGWVALGLGGILVQVGTIAGGVLIGLRAHAAD